MRSDSGGEVEGLFNDPCRSPGIKQEFTPVDSPNFDGDAQRAIVLVISAAISARIQADELHGEDISDKLWGESSRWAADALNRAKTTADPANQSPDKMFAVRFPTKAFPVLQAGLLCSSPNVQFQAQNTIMLLLVAIF